MGLGGAGKVEGAKAVFAGYGRTFPAKYKGQIRDKEVILDNYDDFGGIDVKDKVVFVINDTPGGVRGEGGGRSYLANMLKPKIDAAVKAGAVAVVFVHNQETAATGDDLYDFGYTAVGRRGKDAPTIPVLHIHRAVLETLLAGTLTPDLPELEQERSTRISTPKSFDLTGWTVNLRSQDALRGKERSSSAMSSAYSRARARWPTRPSSWAPTTITSAMAVRGACAPQRPQDGHPPAADDNASGSTSVMELARRFAALPDREGRRLVFMTFTAEGHEHQPVDPHDRAGRRNGGPAP